MELDDLMNPERLDAAADASLRARRALHQPMLFSVATGWFWSMVTAALSLSRGSVNSRPSKYSAGYEQTAYLRLSPILARISTS